MSRIDTREEPTGVEDELPDAHLFWIEVVLVELEEIAQFLEDGQALRSTIEDQVVFETTKMQKLERETHQLVHQSIPNLEKVDIIYPQMK